MVTRTSYWIGKRPSGANRWEYTTSAMVLDEAEYHEKLFEMYRRYVKQWNDIELNRNKSLTEHTHEVHNAKVVDGLGSCFTLHWHNQNNDHWILEINYKRGFSEFYSGLSCRRNPFRSPKDIRSAHLHWNGSGQRDFDRWFAFEKEANKENREWDEYRA